MAKRMMVLRGFSDFSGEGIDALEEFGGEFDWDCFGFENGLFHLGPIR
jgi:hypothetical protein